MDQYEAGSKAFLAARKRVALTGAGISVECGIPDFRSKDGLWSVFAPEEFATLDVFLSNPEKAWLFYRSLGVTLKGKNPGAAHNRLSKLEHAGLLDGLITQNIDGLHLAAGSRCLVEVHGDSRTLHCIRCGYQEPVAEVPPQDVSVPACPSCTFALKPNVVLFGESVRGIDLVLELTEGCDALLVVGTSSSVYPVSEIPGMVAAGGGAVFEFNLIETRITNRADYIYRGRVEETVPRFVDCVIGMAKGN